MTKVRLLKYGCPLCEWHGDERWILRAPNPFAEDIPDEIMGCPQCRNANQLELLCDEEGCLEKASCGYRSADGYRRTCGEHWHPERKATGT